MNTFLNQEIKADTLGILYLCEYSYSPPSIKVVREIQFTSPFEAFSAAGNLSCLLSSPLKLCPEIILLIVIN